MTECLNFEKFFRTPVLQVTSGELLISVQVAEFQPADTVQNYFTSAFEAFDKKTRSRLSKALIFLKYLKIICEEVGNRQIYEKNSFTLPPSCILPSFSLTRITITSSEVALKHFLSRAQFLSRNISKK